MAVTADSLHTEFSVLGEIALVNITLAAPVIPTAWPIAEFVYSHQCDPVAIVTTGTTWLDMVGTLQTAKEQLDTDVAALPDDGWVGRDRDAFDQQLVSYELELSADQVLAVVVGTALIVVGTLLAILIGVLVVVSAILLAFAVLIVALAALGVTAPEAAELEAAADEFAVGAFEALETIGKAVDAVSDGSAALIADTLAANAAAQLGTGNVAVFQDLAQAVVYGSFDTLAGLASADEQDLTGKGIASETKAGSPLAMAYGDSTTFNNSGAVDTAGDWLFGKDAWENGGGAWKGAPEHLRQRYRRKQD
jgi:hypothetical protein